MDREQQRQLRRTTETAFSCTSGYTLPEITNPSPRPSSSCDPPNVQPAALPFIEPLPCPAPPIPAVNLPDGLGINSSTAIAYCPSTAGYSVTGTTAVSLSAGTISQNVIFTVLTDITDNQLNYLYQAVPGSSAAIISASLSGATTSVINLTHLNYSQAEELIINIQTTKFTVDNLAIERARNLLVCQVENTIQNAVCPTGSYTGSSALVPPNFEYTPTASVAAGSVLVTFGLTAASTTGGQTAFNNFNIPSLTAAAEQANIIALSQAESQLRCVYANSATTAACCTSEAPHNNLGYTYCVPATGPSITGSATAVGFYTVASNTIFSAVSSTEANSIAAVLALSSLNCYFPSNAVTVSCTPYSPPYSYAPNSTTSFSLPAGAIILTDLNSSVTAATQQATAIAQSSLNCFWSNDPQSATCPPSGTFTAIDNQQYDLPASTANSVSYTASVGADTVISYSSKTAANEQAALLAQAQLSCIYCSEEVPATCTGGVNETIGATANLVCNALAIVAQNTALSLGNILVSTSGGQLNCCYGNDSVTNNIFCGTGAFRAPGTPFTSADSFFIPENVITVCFSTTGATAGPTLFQYSNLYAGTTPKAAACLDTAPCSVTSGSATALPPLWASQTDLFSAISSGATFYSNTAQTPYTFNPAYPYIVDRSLTYRNYRTTTGSTGFTTGLTAVSCSNYTAYTFRGATLGNYPGSSATLALQDIFCSSSGPTAGLITIYSSAPNPFVIGSTSAWYTDACGLTAFNPVINSSTAARYYAGIIQGGSAGYSVFSTSGSNVSTFTGLYNLGTCSTGPWPDTNPSPTSNTTTYVSYTPPNATGSYKQEANDLAQSIVNGFVRCFYLNDQQISEPCDLGQITVKLGVVKAGEVISMISKEDANERAKLMAESLKVCLSPDQTCGGTIIYWSLPINILGKSLSMEFPKVDACGFQSGFNMTGSFNTNAVKVAQEASIKKLTICTPSGNEDIYVPYWPNSAGIGESDTIGFLASPTGTTSNIEIGEYSSVIDI